MPMQEWTTQMEQSHNELIWSDSSRMLAAQVVARSLPVENPYCSCKLTRARDTVLVGRFGRLGL